MPAQLVRSPSRFQLTVERRDQPATVTLALRGELDLASAPALQRELVSAESGRPEKIVLDLAALSFIDSSALRLLIEAQARSECDGHLLVLSHVSSNAMRLLRLTGLDTRFCIESEPVPRTEALIER
jgi:anti-sigma B factor antagonist